jgi:quinol monooxygenase YgiN
VILIQLIFDTAPEQRESVIELARRTMAATRREKGCVLYRFTTDLDLPRRFILTELWENEDALKAHFARDAFKNFWAELPPGGSFVSTTAWQGPLTPFSPPDPGIRQG